ncbi:MAG: ATP-binding protein [Desulfobaccales bacterium]
MKILSLNIQNIRGIKEADLTLDGKNFVIWGPNGSGKSAVVDAIDFLLTGQIARLIGEGTAGITLAKHGPHIDYTKDPSQSFVKAVVQVPGVSKEVTLRRCMANPEKLEVQGADISQLDEILELAGRRQHSLSRREILRYVAAQAGKRSAEVQALLNLEELETIRKAIGRVLTQAKTDKNNAMVAVTNAENNIKTTLSLGVFAKDAMIGKVNEIRGFLGGSSLAEVDSNNLKDNISPPPPTGVAATLNPKLIENQIASLKATLPSDTIKVKDADSILRFDIQSIKANAQALKDANRLALIKLGISLLDGSGECPLCGWIWDAEELSSNLMRREENAKTISEIIDRIGHNAEIISKAASNVKQFIEKFAEAAKELKLVPQEDSLRACSASLSAIINNTCIEPTQELSTR